MQKAYYENLLAEKDAYIAKLKSEHLDQKNEAMGDLPFQFYNQILSAKFYDLLKLWDKEYTKFVAGQNFSFQLSPVDTAKTFIITMLSNKAIGGYQFTEGLPEPVSNPSTPLFSELYNLTQVPYNDVELTSLDPYVNKIMKVVNYMPSKIIAFHNNTNKQFTRAFDYLYKIAYEGAMNELFLGEFKNLVLDQKNAIIESALNEILVQKEVDNYVNESNALIERLNAEKDNAITTVSQLQEAMLQAKLKFEQAKTYSTQKEDQLNDLKTENQTLIDQIKLVEDQLLKLMSEFEAKQAKLMAEEVARLLEMEKAQQALNVTPEVALEEPVTTPTLVEPETHAIMEATDKANRNKLIKRAGLGVALAYGLYSLLG
jgi:hypothetical protein